MNENLHTEPGGPSGIHEDLLVKFLLDEVSPAEKARVQAWLSEHPGNQRYFEDFRLIWQESGGLGAQHHHVSEEQQEAAWEKFRQRIRRPAHLKAVRTEPLPVNNGQWLRIAAILILVASITAVLYFTNRSTVTEKHVASAGEPLTDSLSDGSIVTLNRNSAISYPSEFRNARIISLKGEAFFKVAPDKQKPFEVHTNGIRITVLGTSFNVRNNADSTTEIIVESGMIRVSDTTNLVTLRQGEKITLNPKDHTITKDSTHNTLYQYYRTKVFTCDNTPLPELVASLEEAYNVTIDITNPALRDLRITTTFSDASLDQILTIIGETLRIEVTENENHITLH